MPTPEVMTSTDTVKLPDREANEPRVLVRRGLVLVAAINIALGSVVGAFHLGMALFPASTVVGDTFDPGSWLLPLAGFAMAAIPAVVLGVVVALPIERLTRRATSGRRTLIAAVAGAIVGAAYPVTAMDSFGGRFLVWFIVTGVAGGLLGRVLVDSSWARRMRPVLVLACVVALLDVIGFIIFIL